MAGLEIERKFLVAELPSLDGVPGDRIQQGYLARTHAGVEVRIRRRAGQCFLTIKSGKGLVRLEEELEIEDDRFERLWPLTEGRRIEKTRYVLEDGIELDVYSGALEGLAVAELEFDDEAASAAFTPPAWLGEDVTEDGRYKNARLAVDGRPDEA